MNWKMNLMYKILGDMWEAYHFMVLKKCKNTGKYSIIIAGIAPIAPGNLWHFNWSKLAATPLEQGF